jgi:hypothetical protein
MSTLEAGSSVDEIFAPRSVYQISLLQPTEVGEAGVYARQGAHDYFAELTSETFEPPDILNLAGRYEPAEVTRLSQANRALSRLALLHTFLSTPGQEIAMYDRGRELAIDRKVQILGDFISFHGNLWVTEESFAVPTERSCSIPMLRLRGVGHDTRRRSGVSGVVEGPYGYPRVFRQPAALFYGELQGHEK